MRQVTLLLITAALLLSCALPGCGKQKTAAPAPVEVSYITTAYSSAPLKEELSGRVRAALTAEVRPQADGIIKARLFEEGAYVEAGQSLYQLEDAPYQAAYERARSDYEYSRVAVESAELKEARLTRLAQQHAIAAQLLDDARFAHRQAVAAMLEKRAAMEAATVALGYTRITAPISGRIGISAVTAGALVSASQQAPLATIHAADTVFVDIPQSVEQLQTLQKALSNKDLAAGSAEVELFLGDGGKYKRTGTLLFKEAVTDEASGTVTLRARFDNPDGKLLPGMFVKAVLAEAVDTKALLLPQSCVQWDAAGKAYVWIVAEGNKIERRDVTLGATIGGSWQIIGGLQAGERVVSSGVNRVRAGDTVRAKETQAGGGKE